MPERINKRYWVIAAAILAMFITLIVQLGRLTIRQAAAELSEKSEDRTTRTITLRGNRGKILDRNGQQLAFNEKSYNIQFLRVSSLSNDVGRALDTEGFFNNIEIVE